VSNFTVLQADSISSNFTRAIGKALAHLEWQPARRNDVPVNSIITMTLTSERRSLYGEVLNTLSIEYPFSGKFPYSKLDRDEAETEQQYFSDASDAFNKQNYAKAVELLGKCVDMDNIDLNAYYLRADAYTKLGKSKEACKDWTTLAGLGQVKAAKKLAEFCKN
jgi:tetratricopeptide (TPR) repeat protein